MSTSAFVVLSQQEQPLKKDQIVFVTFMTFLPTRYKNDDEELGVTNFLVILNHGYDWENWRIP